MRWTRRGAILVVALALTTSCGGEDGSIESAVGDDQAMLDAWREEYESWLSTDASELTNPSDEQIREMNAFYCDDSATDYMDYIETVVYKYLPSGAFEEVSASAMGNAAMVASAQATDCKGLVDRDKIAEGMADGP